MRRWLLALLFCITAWATPALLTPAAADVQRHAAADVSSETEAGAPQGSSDADSWWVAGHQATVPVTASRWKSAGVHADLASARSGIAFIAIGLAGRGDRTTHHRSTHLLHIPLLI